MSSWIGSARSRNPSAISRGQFGAVALPRILALLERFEVRTSFAAPGHTAYAYPKLVRESRERGHELIHHGWVHENPADFDEPGERRVIERGHRMLLLERLLEHFSTSGVSFEPMGDYVERWRKANPIDEWRNANPHLTGADAIVP